MADTDNINGNLSTIFVWVYVILAPYIAQYMTQDQFVTLCIAVIGIIGAVYSSYNPNTFKFLHNEPTSTNVEYENEEKVLNDEYEDGC